MKLNKKGFTVVELLATFTLTMVIVTLLFEVVLELKNIYEASSLQTGIKNENALIAREVNKQIDDGKMPSISFSGVTIQIENKKFTMPSDCSIVDFATTNNCDAEGNNCYLQVKYNVTSDNLDKDIPFNLVLSY